MWIIDWGMQIEEDYCFVIVSGFEMSEIKDKKQSSHYVIYQLPCNQQQTYSINLPLL